MAKKEVKTVVHTEAYATKDTFWNTERVNRGLTYNQISEYVGRPIGTVCGWFIGKTRPNRDTVSELCNYFNSINYTDGSVCNISYQRGMEEFEDAYKKYNAAGGKTVVCRSDKKETKEVIKSMDTSVENRNVNTINFLLRQRHMTYRQLANELKCTVTMIRRWVKGLDVPNDIYIGKMADILEYDSDKLNDLFEKAYHKYRNIDGQIDIAEALKTDIVYWGVEEDSTQDTVGKESEIKSNTEEQVSDAKEEVVSMLALSALDNALERLSENSDNRQKFVQWFKLLTSISVVRITDAEVTEIMTHYISMDYNMFNALEAWHNEDNPNYIHERYILLTCERKNWLGEDYER